MIDIKTQYAGLTLRNPLIVGSSGLTNNAERNKEFEKAGAGAIVLKSLFGLSRSSRLHTRLCKGESDKRLSGTDPEDERIMHHSGYRKYQLL